MDDLQELRNGSPHQPKSEFSHVIDFLKESLWNCRKIYCIPQADLRYAIVMLEPFVTLLLYTALGSYDIVCYFILFYFYQTNWQQFYLGEYGIDRTRRVKGVDTTYNPVSSRITALYRHLIFNIKFMVKCRCPS